MRLSTKVRYSTRAIIEIAISSENNVPIKMRLISVRQSIPMSYLEQLLMLLRRAGFVKSVRGPSGGYVLAKKPFEITLLDIITAVDGEFNLTQCLALGEEYCVKIDKCVARRFWDRLQNVIKSYLKKITLEQLAQKQRELWIKADNR